MKKIVNNRKDTEIVTRRDFLKGLLGFIVLAIISTPLYSFLLERFWIDTTHINLTMKRLPRSFSGLKIIHISDFHLGFFFDTANLKKVVKQVNRLQPDLICFSGDLVDDGVGILKEALPILKGFQAKIGKISILGNHDYREGLQNEVTNCLEKAGFTMLINQAISIRRGNDRIHIAGVDDLFGGHPDLKRALIDVPQTDFTLLLAHEPDLADSFSNEPVDLQLSGHSHGGQIRLPIVGALFTPDGAKKYVEGLKKITDSELLLYVNRGIGTTFLPFRFDCRPEITVLTLTS